MRCFEELRDVLSLSPKRRLQDTKGAVVSVNQLGLKYYLEIPILPSARRLSGKLFEIVGFGEEGRTGDCAVRPHAWDYDCRLIRRGIAYLPAWTWSHDANCGFSKSGNPNLCFIFISFHIFLVFLYTDGG
jgi:hypothetical protein